MIADFMKNQGPDTLPAGIRDGIRLHRAIDAFTDAPPAVRQAKKVFSPEVRLYAGAFVDVSFDYFLANDPNIKSEREWAEHSQGAYRALEDHAEFLPPDFKTLLPKMKRDDWLYGYRYEQNIALSFRNVVLKARYLDKAADVFPLFLRHKSALQQSYSDFFPELRAYCQSLR